MRLSSDFKDCGCAERRKAIDAMIDRALKAMKDKIILITRENGKAGGK